MLLTVQEYRNFTRDLSTVASEVTARIEVATELVQEETRRTLVETTLTETLELWADSRYSFGHVYPSITPVTAVTSGATLDPRFNTRVLVDSQPSIIVGVLGLNRPILIDVSYTGGYTTTTCPIGLKLAIARLAQAAFSGASSITGGTAVHVGDVSVTYNKAAVAGSLDQMVPGISATLRKYRRRTVNVRQPEDLLVGRLA